MDVKWIKISTDFLHNRKIIELRTLKGGDRMVLIWVMLLLVAGRCNKGGRLMLTDELPYNTKMLANYLGFSVKALELAFEQFVRLNMIIVRDGVIIIKNWEKYQNVESMDRLRENTRKRVAKHRAKCNVTVTQNVTACNAAEEEGETEKEIELEFHSINQATASGFDDDFVENFVENSNKAKRRELIRGELGQGVVLLSNEQFDDLLDRLSLEEFEKYVGVVRDMELQGKHYKKKTHYQAILDMAEKDRALR